MVDILFDVDGVLVHGDPQKLIDYRMQRDAVVTPGLLPYIERLHANPNVQLFIATNQEATRAGYLMDTVAFGRYFQDIFNAASAF